MSDKAYSWLWRLCDKSLKLMSNWHGVMWMIKLGKQAYQMSWRSPTVMLHGQRYN